MIVKWLNYQLIFLIASMLIDSITAAGIKCNMPLLNHYKLTGIEFSIYHQMKVCPNVRERCCSFSDEVIIQNLWNTRSKFMLNRHRDKCLQHIQRTINYFNIISKFDPQLIIVKHGVVRTVPYVSTTCRTRLEPVKRKEIEKIEGYFNFGAQVERPLIQPPAMWLNKWQSRNPAHLYWNLVNQGNN